MTRKLRPATAAQVDCAKLALDRLRDARRWAQQADSPRLVARIESAIKSAGGALRHVEGRLIRTGEGGYERVEHALEAVSNIRGGMRRRRPADAPPPAPAPTTPATPAGWLEPPETEEGEALRAAGFLLRHVTSSLPLRGAEMPHRVGFYLHRDGLGYVVAGRYRFETAEAAWSAAAGCIAPATPPPAVNGQETGQVDVFTRRALHELGYRLAGSNAFLFSPAGERLGSHDSAAEAWKHASDHYTAEMSPEAICRAAGYDVFRGHADGRWFIQGPHGYQDLGGVTEADAWTAAAEHMASQPGAFR